MKNFLSLYMILFTITQFSFAQVVQVDTIYKDLFTTAIKEYSTKKKLVEVYNILGNKMHINPNYALENLKGKSYSLE